MPQLSVVIITFNEEKNIGRCLDSVKPVADDIVVLDSFSTDNTQKICEEKGARFIQHKFDGHIEQKNRAISHAKFPHILSVDADEVLSEKLRQSILDAKNNWKYDGYFVNRLNNYCGKWIKHCGWYPNKKLRLWDSRKGKWTGENPHDKYKLNSGAASSRLKGDLLHYSYTTISEHIDQIQKFSTIAAVAKFKKGKKIALLLIVIRPFAIFLNKYFMKLGFLDGYYGFVVSMLSAYTTFLKDIKLKELHKGKEL